MDKRTINGLAVGVTLQILALVALAFYYQAGVGVVEYLKNAVQYKSIVKLGVFASIPNIALFFWQVNQNKVRFARGVQYVIIAFVLFLVLVKFI